MIKRKYKCPKCGHEFEQVIFESMEERMEWDRKNPDRPSQKTRCPKCGTIV